MSFLSPGKVPDPKTPAVARQPDTAASPLSQAAVPKGVDSLISTSATGLKRKASTAKTSLLGG